MMYLSPIKNGCFLLLAAILLGSGLEPSRQVARANWQHGAEACQRGLHEAKGVKL